MGKAEGTEAEKRKKSKPDWVLGTWLPSILLRYRRGETAGVSGEGAVNTIPSFSLCYSGVFTFCGVKVKNIRKPELEEVC